MTLEHLLSDAIILTMLVLLVIDACSQKRND